MADRENIVFLFIGGGHQLGALKAEVVRRGLANVQFRPYQPLFDERFAMPIAVERSERLLIGVSSGDTGRSLRGESA